MNVEYKSESIWMSERIKKLEADNLFLKEEIEALTHTGRQGELEQANVMFGCENLAMRNYIRPQITGGYVELIIPETEKLVKRFAAAERVCEALDDPRQDNSQVEALLECWKESRK